MRRLLAILLLLVFALPGAAPLLASTAAAEAQVPMCCRQGGAHHCAAMSNTGRPALRMSCPLAAQPVAPLPNQTGRGGAGGSLRSPEVVSVQDPDRAADDPRGQWIAARDSRGPPQT